MQTSKPCELVAAYNNSCALFPNTINKQSQNCQNTTKTTSRDVLKTLSAYWSCMDSTKPQVVPFQEKSFNNKISAGLLVYVPTNLTNQATKLQIQTLIRRQTQKKTFSKAIHP